MIAVYKLSNGVVQDLLKIIRPYASELYSMVECIGLLDMLLRYLFDDHHDDRVHDNSLEALQI